MTEAPEHIVTGLKSIRSTFFLKWNPTAKRIGESSFDVNGNAREVKFDGRWELWDVDAEGALYMVMRLEDNDGSFIPPGDWLIHTLNLMNPARYNGSVEKMLKALVHEPNAELEKIREQDWNNLVDSMARYYTLRKPIVSVL